MIIFAKKKVKYIYLSNKYFDGTIYKTQIIDWLALFSHKGVTFEIYQIFHIKDILRIKFWISQIKTIKKHTELLRGILFLLPSKGILVYMNSLQLYFRFFWYLLHYDKVLIFTRGLLGKEMRILKRFCNSRIVFYFDARAASAEENKYDAYKKDDFSLQIFKTIAHIYHTEYITLLSAERIFAVSEKLIEYFKQTYKMDPGKFILYPCLSDSTKFYYSEKIRNETRSGLKIANHNTVILYSGGLSVVNKYHISAEMFTIFNAISNFQPNIIFLILTKDKFDLTSILKTYPGLVNKLLFKNAENEQIFEFLNAADFGVLFRENTIMNNVASPSKYAEYILCGLPVLISEGVGDFSKFTLDHKLGRIITNAELKYPHEINFHQIFSQKFDRQYISQIGIQYLSKNSILNKLVDNFKEY